MDLDVSKLKITQDGKIKPEGVEGREIWFYSLHRKLQCQPLKDFKVKFYLRLGKIPAQKTAMPTPEGLRNFGERRRQPIFLFWYTETGFELEEDWLLWT